MKYPSPILNTEFLWFISWLCKWYTNPVLPNYKLVLHFICWYVPHALKLKCYEMLTQSVFLCIFFNFSWNKKSVAPYARQLSSHFSARRPDFIFIYLKSGKWSVDPLEAEIGEKQIQYKFIITCGLLTKRKHDYDPCHRNCNKCKWSFKINYSSHKYTRFNNLDVANSTCPAISWEFRLIVTFQHQTDPQSLKYLSKERLRQVLRKHH